MPHRLLVANRGEIAVRVLRAASELGIGTVAVYPDDDTRSLHVRRADEARRLGGAGVAAYLDGEQILRVAQDANCDAIHPGYGFLAENAAFAQRCAEEGVTFVGPSAELLELFGDKLRARALAAERGVPVLPGATEAVSEGEARAFLESLGPGGAMMIKAVAGGGGRGMRVVRTSADVAEAFARCQSEAQAAFGDGALYVEQLIEQARHIEVQVAGDGTGAVMHFGERDCSIQRRHQKLIEIAPAPGLPGGLRQRIIDAAVDLAASARYASLGTFEFLVDARDLDDGSSFSFIEANPRLQVEHTITEEVTGIDLVQLQLRLADGATLAELGMSQADLPAPRGFAIQARVNMETIRPDGAVLPSGGRLTAFEPPGGPGVRTDTFGYAGYETSMRFDSLLAKVIGHTPSPSFEEAVRRTHRALREFRIEGVQTNIPFLLNLLDHPGVRAARLHTAFIDDYLTDLLDAGGFERAALHFADTPESAGPDPAAASVAAPERTVTVEAHLQGTVVSLDVAEGDTVRAGQQLAVLEALKMEHVIEAPSGGVVRTIVVRAGETVHAGVPLLFLEPSDEAGEQDSGAEEIDLDAIRPDLAEVERRRALALDAGRPAVQRHHERGGRAARENIEDLCDAGTFVEYGQLAIPSDVNRPVQELIERYPGDGLVMGLGSINGSLFGEPAARCVVLAYDYTVLAGTQGRLNHRKSDRMLDIAAELRAPVVWFTEGGGGRAHGGGGDPFGNASGGWGGLETPTWRKLGQLSGLVPLVAINSGYSFAGNAAVLGSCDVVIATGNSSIGMGGPAMIEGGGLGIYTPDQVGPMSVQRPNGVVDLAVEDEAEAVQAAKQYLSYFQGNLDQWDAEDQRLLRRVIPEHRLRVYDVRRVIDTMADAGSVMELRRDFGLTMVTALARIEGRPLGIIANNPLHLSGAIDSDGADKAARFMQLCDAFDLPVIFLCDTPGIMVGPEAEKTALVRHSSRMFVIGANLTVPTITVVLRKAYGLGAMTMAAGSFKATQLTVSWPTGEFGAMGLEGMVRLGSREELDAIDDPEEREARFTELVAVAYERGKALNSALGFGLDDVIDPADTRALIANVLRSQRPPAPRERKKRPYVDPW
jgi:acetyl/propionyl-CoA carboxylase alpha subunit/acetyl-CoA carboxylase carboxyltransferase component